MTLCDEAFFPVLNLNFDVPPPTANSKLTKFESNNGQWFALAIYTKDAIVSLKWHENAKLLLLSLSAMKDCIHTPITLIWVYGCMDGLIGGIMPNH